MSSGARYKGDPLSAINLDLMVGYLEERQAAGTRREESGVERICWGGWVDGWVLTGCSRGKRFGWGTFIIRG